MTGGQYFGAESLLDLRDRLARGEMTAVALAKACLARVSDREEDIRAWVRVDENAVLEQAARVDDQNARGEPPGPLHGLPIGVKDIIDTADLPTENGCPLDAGRAPTTDASVVSRLKAAGAVIFGKTVTTEFAFLHPGKTRNPVNPKHTPGGSSSGSAAAVAAGMVPLSVGTQTAGSVIRPASFCGIVGFKPSFGAIPRDGILCQSHSLDTVGVFANDLSGVGMLAEALCNDAAGAGLSKAATCLPSRTPVFAFVQPPGWDGADAALQQALASLCDTLGNAVVPTALPDVFTDVLDHRIAINTAEMGYHFRRYLEVGAHSLGPATRKAIEDGQKMRASTYLAALERQQALRPALDVIFDKCDAILCPATPGPAPEGLGATGDSLFNGLWTMAGTPAVTLPLFTAPNGLPMGLQLVGRHGEDARLLSAARWLWNRATQGAAV